MPLRKVIQMNLYVGLTGILVFLMFYFVMTQYFAHRRFNYLQETAIAIVIGILVGILIRLVDPSFFQNSQSNEQLYIRDVIILFLLPLIMFEDGYNFPRRKFFQNFQLINLYGLLGTIASFFVIWSTLYALNNANLFVSISDSQEPITLLNWQIMLIASALCSIQPVVTEKVVDKETHPKLFSIIFGQSLYKDTLAITLFESINDYVIDNNSSTFDIDGENIGLIFLRFLKVISCSICIGLAMGFCVTVLFKNMRFLIKEKGISEMSLTIIAGFLCYVLSEWAAFSGVISMLFCGTILAHYNTYNLTQQGKTSTLITIEVLKIGACGMIFFFIGFEVFSVQSFQSAIDHLGKSSFSGSLLGFTLLTLIVSRVVNIYVMSLLGWLLTKKGNWRLNSYEYCIIFLGGLVHGVVPFALSVTLPTNKPTSSCTQLNIILVVLITSLFLNMIIPKLEKILLAKIRELQKNDPTHPSLKDSFFFPKKMSGNHLQSILGKPGENAFLTNFMSSSQRYWKKFDEGALKPFLIYDYYQRRDQIKLDKIKKRMEEHQKFLSRFNIEPENILHAQNEYQNIFYELSDEGKSSSSNEEKGVIKIRMSMLSKNNSEGDKIEEQQKGRFEKRRFAPDYNTQRFSKSLEENMSDYGRQKRGQTQLVPIPPLKQEKRPPRQKSQGKLQLKIEQREPGKDQ